MYSSGNSHLPKLLYLVLRPSSKNNSYEKFFFHSRNSQNISIDAPRTMLCSTLSIQKCRSKNVGQKTSIRKHRSENVDPKTSVQKRWYKNGDSKTSVQKCWYENVDPKKSIQKCRYKKRRYKKTSSSFRTNRTTSLWKRRHLSDSNERRYEIFTTTINLHRHKTSTKVRNERRPSWKHRNERIIVRHFTVTYVNKHVRSQTQMISPIRFTLQSSRTRDTLAPLWRQQRVSELPCLAAWISRVVCRAVWETLVLHFIYISTASELGPSR